MCIRDRDNSLINRYIKFHPFELLGKDYDYSVYIDGNITPVTDLTVFTEKINPEIGIAMHMHSQRNCVYDEAKACMILGKGQKANIEKQIKRYEDQGFPYLSLIHIFGWHCGKMYQYRSIFLRWGTVWYQ